MEKTGLLMILDLNHAARLLFLFLLLLWKRRNSMQNEIHLACPCGKGAKKVGVTKKGLLKKNKLAVIIQ